VPKEAEAVFLGGNGMRTIGAIQALEKALGRPVITSNQVAFWGALRMANINARVSGYGQLFEKQLPRA
jgi:maleate isomerase